MNKRPPPNKKAAVVQLTAKKLDSLLVKLKATARYPALASLNLAQLLQDKSISSELLLSDLVERGSKLLHDTKSKEKSCSIISAFLTGAPKVTPLELPPPKKVSSNVPQFMSGSDMEKLIREAQNNFRSKEQNLDVELGTFWPKDAPRAPFEESLTIKQFLGLSPDSLLKKRSFGPAKILALHAASKNLSEKKERAPAEKKVLSSPLLFSSKNQKEDAKSLPSSSISVALFYSLDTSSNSVVARLVSLFSKLSPSSVEKFLDPAVELTTSDCETVLADFYKTVPELAKFWSTNPNKEQRFTPYLSETFHEQVEQLLLQRAFEVYCYGENLPEAS